MKLKHIAVSLFASVLLIGCGGGGGGSDAPPPSAETYQVWQSWVNSARETVSRSFTASGTMSGFAVTGSGSVATGPLENGTFEGRAALVKTAGVAGTVTIDGQTFPLVGMTTNYLDVNYLPLGLSNGEYGVVTGVPSFPQTARVNDTGVLFTYLRYPDSAKTSSIGSGVVSYELVAETATTAILRLITVDKRTDGSLESTTVRTSRITPDGTLTPLTEEYRSGADFMTTTYLAVL